MRLPVPKNSLVALTLAGALLTAVVAVALTAPGAFGVTQTGPSEPNTDGNALATDAPQPNESFTPAVQTQASGEHEEEHEESEGDEDSDDEYEDEEHEDDD